MPLLSEVLDKSYPFTKIEKNVASETMKLWTFESNNKTYSLRMMRPDQNEIFEARVGVELKLSECNPASLRVKPSSGVPGDIVTFYSTVVKILEEIIGTDDYASKKKCYMMSVPAMYYDRLQRFALRVAKNKLRSWIGDIYFETSPRVGGRNDGEYCMFMGRRGFDMQKIIKPNTNLDATKFDLSKSPVQQQVDLTAASKGKIINTPDNVAANSKPNTIDTALADNMFETAMGLIFTYDTSKTAHDLIQSEGSVIISKVNTSNTEVMQSIKQYALAYDIPADKFASVTKLLFRLKQGSVSSINAMLLIDAINAIGGTLPKNIKTLISTHDVDKFLDTIALIANSNAYKKAYEEYKRNNIKGFDVQQLIKPIEFTAYMAHLGIDIHNKNSKFKLINNSVGLMTLKAPRINTLSLWYNFSSLYTAVCNGCGLVDDAGVPITKDFIETGCFTVNNAIDMLLFVAPARISSDVYSLILSKLTDKNAQILPNQLKPIFDAFRRYPIPTALTIDTVKAINNFLKNNISIEFITEYYKNDINSSMYMDTATETRVDKLYYEFIIKLIDGGAKVDLTFFIDKISNEYAVKLKSLLTTSTSGNTSVNQVIEHYKELGFSSVNAVAIANKNTLDIISVSELGACCTLAKTELNTALLIFDKDAIKSLYFRIVGLDNWDAYPDMIYLLKAFPTELLNIRTKAKFVSSMYFIDYCNTPSLWIDDVTLCAHSLVRFNKNTSSNETTLINSLRYINFHWNTDFSYIDDTKPEITALYVIPSIANGLDLESTAIQYLSDMKRAGIFNGVVPNSDKLVYQIIQILISTYQLDFNLSEDSVIKYSTTTFSRAIILSLFNVVNGLLQELLATKAPNVSEIQRIDSLGPDVLDRINDLLTDKNVEYIKENIQNFYSRIFTMISLASERNLPMPKLYERLANAVIESVLVTKLDGYVVDITVPVIYMLQHIELNKWEVAIRNSVHEDNLPKFIVDLVAEFPYTDKKTKLKLFEITESILGNKTKNVIVTDIMSSLYGETIYESDIKPLEKLSATKIKKVLSFNNITPKDLKIRKKANETYAQMAERMMDDVSSISALLPEQKISNKNTNDEDLKQATKRLRATRNNKHGNVELRVLEVFDANLVFPEYNEYRNAHPNCTIAKNWFHSTGSVAASFILRTGFTIIPSGDDSCVGRMLGDGIYLASNIDKSQQYIGDEGWGRRYGTIGYVFECEIQYDTQCKKITPKNPTGDYATAGFGRDNVKSPEIALLDPRAQIKVYKVYKCVLVSASNLDRWFKGDTAVTESKLSKFINEANADNVVNITFGSGMVPVSATITKPFEEFMGKFTEVTFTQMGPMFSIPNTFGYTGNYLIPDTDNLMQNDPENILPMIVKLFGN